MAPVLAMDPAHAITKDGGVDLLRHHRLRQGGTMIGDRTMAMIVAQDRRAMITAAQARIEAMAIANTAMDSASGFRIGKTSARYGSSLWRACCRLNDPGAERTAPPYRRYLDELAAPDLDTHQRKTAT